MNDGQNKPSYVCLKGVKVILNRLDVSEYITKTTRKKSVAATDNQSVKSGLNRAFRSEPNLYIRETENKQSDQWILKQIQSIYEENVIDQVINDMVNILNIDG